MRALFISDLHLEPAREDITEAFLSFCDSIAPDAQQLYILGDFFEAWIGDDENTPLQIKIKQSLARLSARGVKIFFMPGNRDFLIGQGFADETGITLIPDPLVVDLNGIPTLLMHGDTLCTDDEEYLAFRARIRDPKRIKRLLSLPLVIRKLIARLLRLISKHRNKNKSIYIMDVTPAAVEQAMCTAGVTRLIHGHTHRPAIHKVPLPEGRGERIVLGDWHQQGWYGEVLESGEFRTHTFKFSSQNPPS
ncbi:MAG: UDP-2,3-diacylglucosamine diphosphatase [Hahellaceae bacterium]|nr:UDP-2,3-diacylglucosamine diphosphatase [Hahellaceae bacterium]